MFRQLAVATTAALTLPAGGDTRRSESRAAPPSEVLAVYTGTVDVAGLDAIVDLGVDRHEVVTTTQRRARTGRGAGDPEPGAGDGAGGSGDGPRAEAAERAAPQPGRG